jgi:hypothetical protein
MKWLCSIQEYWFSIYLDGINKLEDMNYEYYSSNTSEILKGVLLKIQAFQNVTVSNGT